MILPASSDLETRPPAVVLGSGHNGLGVVRSLGRKGITVVAVHSDATDAALSSRFCSRLISPDPRADEQGYLDFLINLSPQQTASKPVLIPTGDVQVLLMARHRERLLNHFDFRMASADTVESLINKRKFSALAEAHGLPTPRTRIVSDEAALEIGAKELIYPCLVKPAYSPSWGDRAFRRRFGREAGGWIKYILVRSQEELLRSYPELAGLEPDLVIQEYVEGGDDCLFDFYSYLDADSEPLGMFMIRKIRTLPIDGNGIGTCVESVWNEELAESSLRFLKAIRYQGNSAVCFKRCARTGSFYCIEVNARLALHHSLAGHCGVDLPYMAYLDAIGERPARAAPRIGPVKWISIWDDLASFRKYRARGDITFRHWLSSLRGEKAHCFWATDDPKPFLRKSAMAIVGILIGPARARKFMALARRRAPGMLHDTALPGVSRPTGASRFPRRRRDRGLSILVYHAIGKPNCMEPSLYVSEERFEKQVTYLVGHYRVLSLQAAVDLMERGDPLPDKNVVLTFDDGYRDNYEKAFPVLKKHGCPATIFVATESLETGESLWLNRLYFWCKTTKASELRLRRPEQNPMVLSLRTALQRKRAFYAIKSLVILLDPRRRDALVGEIAERLGFKADRDPFSQALMLTWDQLQEMAAAGVSIGSHTMTHPVLTTLGPEEAMHELTGSKALLERKLHRPSTLFAYPFGEREHFNSEMEAMVRKAGYKAACSAIEGVNFPGTNRFALHRIHVRDEPTPIFALKLWWSARGVYQRCDKKPKRPPISGGCGVAKSSPLGWHGEPPA
jgi:D-aspartate ligase